MDEPKPKTDNRIRSAGIRMALKLLPEVPRVISNYE